MKCAGPWSGQLSYLGGRYAHGVFWLKGRDCHGDGRNVLRLLPQDSKDGVILAVGTAIQRHCWGGRHRGQQFCSVRVRLIYLWFRLPEQLGRGAAGDQDDGRSRKPYPSYSSIWTSHLNASHEARSVRS
jgi:hypothetical protein